MSVQYLPVKVEWKAASDDSNVVEGYASVFDVIDRQADLVKKGAFRKTLRERVPSGQVKFLDSHIGDGAHVLGTVIEAKEDDHGLWFKARLSTAPSAQDVRVKMLEGHLDRLSIGYRTVKDSWQDAEDGTKVRVLHELKLYEVSVVAFPANPEAAVLAVKEAIRVAGSGLVEADPDERKELAETLSESLSGALDEPVTLVVGRDRAEVKAALTAVPEPTAEPSTDGEAKLLDSEIRSALTDAGRERYGGDGRYVYVDDREVDDEWAVFVIHSDDEGARWMRVSYTRDEDDTIALGDDDEEVVVVTGYEPKSATPTPPSGEPAAELSLKEIMRRATAVLEGRDPNEVAEPTQVASLTTRLEIEERLLRDQLPPEEVEAS